jgi:hypothetical protein
MAVRHVHLRLRIRGMGAIFLNTVVGRRTNHCWRLSWHALAYRGSPQSMKMGTTRWLFPYDAATRCASRSAKLRHPMTLHYASKAALLINPRIMRAARRLQRLT